MWVCRGGSGRCFSHHPAGFLVLFGKPVLHDGNQWDIPRRKKKSFSSERMVWGIFSWFYYSARFQSEDILFVPFTFFKRDDGVTFWKLSPHPKCWFLGTHFLTKQHQSTLILLVCQESEYTILQLTLFTSTLLQSNTAMTNHHLSRQNSIFPWLIFHSHLSFFPGRFFQKSLPSTSQLNPVVETRQVSECVQLFMNLDITERKAIAAEAGVLMDADGGSCGILVQQKKKPWEKFRMYPLVNKHSWLENPHL